LFPSNGWAGKPEFSAEVAAGRVYTFRAFITEKHLFEAPLWKQKSNIAGILYQAGI